MCKYFMQGKYNTFFFSNAYVYDYTDPGSDFKSFSFLVSDLIFYDLK